MKIKINGRILNENQCIRSLMKKGAKHTRGNIDLIDISSCKNLGNKSWGMIDFLDNHCYDIGIIGKGKYMERNAK